MKMIFELIKHKQKQHKSLTKLYSKTGLVSYEGSITFGAAYDHIMNMLFELIKHLSSELVTDISQFIASLALDFPVNRKMIQTCMAFCSYDPSMPTGCGYSPVDVT